MTLPKRWTTLSYHKDQQALYQDQRRFIVVPSGRRSGKTECGEPAAAFGARDRWARGNGAEKSG